MSQINDIRTFDGGMDQDSPDELVAANDYRKLTNGRSRYGKVVNLKGTTSVNAQLTNNPDLAENNYTTIGSCVDLENKAIIDFKYNSTAAYCAIHRTYNENNFIEVIHVGAIFNFSLDYPIIDAAIVDDYLIWTDNYNPPRMLNIKKAADLNGLSWSAGTYYLGEIVQNDDSVWKCITTSTAEEPTGTPTY